MTIMKKITSPLKALLALAVASAGLSSCIKEQEMPDYKVNTPIKIEVENPLEFPCGTTKSSYSDSDFNRITDLNIIVYHNGTILRRSCRYFKPADNISISLPDNKDGFNIYILGNVGNITMKAPEMEKDIQTFRYVAASYDDFRTKGFPVANKFKDYKKGSPAFFKLQRMVGQYNITITTKATDAEYTIKKVRLKNCALDIYPFSDTPIKAEIFASQTESLESNPGDYLSDDDIRKLNNGQPVDLYFIENLQGTLLPDNTDPTKKTPTSLDNPAVAGRCTYLEIIADVKTPAGQYTDGRYRYYLGADATTNFDIHRNRKYLLNIRMAQDMVSEDGWRVEVAPPSIIGKIHTDKDEADVIKGVEDMIFISAESGNHANLGYSVEYAPAGVFFDENGRQYTEKSTLGASAINYRLKEENVRGQKMTGIHITSNKAINGIHSPGSNGGSCGCVILAIKSDDKYNGDAVLVKYVKVNVYDKAWPIIFKKNPTDKKLYAYIENPLGLNFRVGVYDGSKTIDTPAEIDPETGRPRPGTGVIEQKNGEFYRIFSNIEYTDTQGNWVIPDDSRRWCDRMSYQAMSTGNNVNVLHIQPDWSKFNLIDDRADAKNISVWIEPIYKAGTIHGGNQMMIRCTDNSYHTLTYAANSYVPYPRFSGKIELMDMSRPKEQLGVGYYPAGIPSCADDVAVSLANANQGSWSVSTSGKFSGCLASSIQDCDFIIHGNPKYYPIFNNVNDNKTHATEAPFYIANGIATIFKLDVLHSDPSKIGGKNATLRGFRAELYGPGRDLEASVAGSHSAEYFTKNQKQIGGKIHRWFHSKGYYYPGTFMTINGYISWPHGATTATGTSVPVDVGF